MDNQTKLLDAGKCCEKATNSKPCCDDCVAESMGYASQYEEQSNKSSEEVPQVKSVGEIAVDYVDNDGFNHYSSLQKSFLHRGFCDGYKSAQSRIAELERNEHSDAKHISSLEKQLKCYQQIIDKHIISSANYTAEYVDKVIVQRDKYSKFLEYLLQESGSLQLIYFKTEIKQVLNSKENG